MRRAIEVARRFLRDESGLETVEWGIIAGIIVAGTVAVISSIGTWTNGKLTDLDTQLP